MSRNPNYIKTDFLFFPLVTAFGLGGTGGDIWEYCPNSFHVVYFATLVEDNGIDGMRLTCNDPSGKILKSKEHSPNGYGPPTPTCSQGFTKAKGRAIPDQGAFSGTKYGLRPHVIGVYILFTSKLV